MLSVILISLCARPCFEVSAVSVEPLAFGRPAVPAKDFESKRAKLESELVPKFEELATSANGLKAYASRNRCYRVIQALNEDHPGARRGLKYRRVDGEWVAGSSRRNTKDAKSKRAVKLAVEIDELIKDYLRVMLPLIESHAESLGPDAVAMAYRRVLTVDSSNGDARAHLG